MKLLRTFLATLLVVSTNTFAGVWGPGSFENDSAFDWSYELENSNGLGAIQRTLSNVLTSSYLEVDACSNAVAAAEVIAAMRSGDYKPLPENIGKWAEKTKSAYEPELAKLALRALDSCRSSESSELAQLWADAGATEWESALKRIEDRLK